MSLTKKLVLAFLLVALIPLGVIVWVSHRTFFEQARPGWTTTSASRSYLRCSRPLSPVACNEDLRSL